MSFIGRFEGKMFAVAKCSLPVTGGGSVVLFLAALLGVLGFITLKYAQKSTAQLSAVVLPLVLIAGAGVIPAANNCVENDSAVISATTTVPLVSTTTMSTTTSISPSTTSTTTIPRTCAQGGVCAVGETGPGGGKVFYVASSLFSAPGTTCSAACRYLEAAPDGWNGSVDPIRFWSEGISNWNTALATPTLFTIGSGLTNSLSIIAQGNSDPAVSAASLARSYAGGGLTDWYLPSHDELNEMYLARLSVGVFSANDYYWSSTESPSNGAWSLRFQNFDLDSVSKSADFGVRPVRAFG